MKTILYKKIEDNKNPKNTKKRILDMDMEELRAFQRANDSYDDKLTLEQQSDISRRWYELSVQRDYENRFKIEPDRGGLIETKARDILRGYSIVLDRSTKELSYVLDTISLDQKGILTFEVELKSGETKKVELEYGKEYLTKPYYLY